MSSLWNKISTTATEAANAVSVAAVSAAKSAEAAVNDLKSYPTSVQCAGCLTVNPVPPAVWDWTCVVCYAIMT